MDILEMEILWNVENMGNATCGECKLWKIECGEWRLWKMEIGDCGKW